MVSHLQITAAHSAERRCTRKIKIKSRRDQATIKMGYTDSRGRQTTSQEGLHPQALLLIGSSGLLNYWGFKWEYIGTLLITSILLLLMADANKKMSAKRRALDLSLKSQILAFSVWLGRQPGACILTSEMERGIYLKAINNNHLWFISKRKKSICTNISYLPGCKLKTKEVCSSQKVTSALPSTSPMLENPLAFITIVKRYSRHWPAEIEGISGVGAHSGRHLNPTP